MKKEIDFKDKETIKRIIIPSILLYFAVKNEEEARKELNKRFK